MIEGAWLWLRSALQRRRLEREMHEEMAQHLERATERLMARGLSARAARRAAEREFGNVAWLQDQARDARGTAWLDALVGDARFALHHFRRRPITFALMLVVLVAGMSISTTLFSYVHTYAVQAPPGIERAADLVRIRGSASAGVYGRGHRAFAREELDMYRALAPSHFDEVAGWTFASVVLDAGDAAELRALEARATFVTENYFAVLGVRPRLGPGLSRHAAADPSLAATAVISHNTWHELFGGDPAVIGAMIIVNGVPLTIVGVAPEGFGGVGGFGHYRLWLPLAMHDGLVLGNGEGFRAAARLRPGVGPREATAAAGVVATRAAASDAELAALEPETDVVPLLSANGDPMFERDVRLMSLALGLLGLLVLLVTCTNVSALLTGLATARRQEIAVRLSLGAARGRLIRQLLTESALLGITAGAAALALVASGFRLLNRLVPELPFQLGITSQATVFTFGIALAVGLLFGLSPALHATRLAIAGVLRDASGNVVAARARLQRGLVVAQIAFTQPLIVLLAAVLLLVLGSFQPVERSAAAERVISLAVRAPASADAATPDARAQRRVELRALVERLRATPGVDAVVPSHGAGLSLGAYHAQRDDAAPTEGAAGTGIARTAPATVRLSAERVEGDYFDVMGVRIVRGRAFTTDDAGALDAGGEVPIILDADVARQLWHGADPLGRRLVASSDTATTARTLVVVGVVADPLARASRRGDELRVFVPADTAVTTSTLLVRTAWPAHTLLATVRAVALQHAPGRVVHARTLAEMEEEQYRTFRLLAGGISAAGLAALLLAALGLYAVVALAVGQRRREIAVRLAVGGRSAQIVRRFVADGMLLSAIGLGLGLPVSVLALRMLMLQPGVPYVALPPVTAIAAAGVALVACIAAWIPARRAAGVEPAVTLRAE